LRSARGAVRSRPALAAASLALLLCGEHPALAQGQAAPAAAPSGVIGYPAAYFASLGVDTAYDMVLRLPGFTLDDGSAVRGFAGAAGNVLIDGQRPASKTDDLISILKRIPAAQVERIDLIRGATPGIDMQGKTVVANVIRRRASGFTGLASLGQYTVFQGYADPQARLEGAWHWGERSLEASLIYAEGHDDSHGSGRRVIEGPSGQVVDSSRTTNSNPSWQYRATAAYETPLAGGKLKANLILEDQPSALTSIDRFVVAGRQTEHDRTDPWDGEAGLHYTRALSSSLGLELFGLQHLNRVHATSSFVTASENQLFDLRDHGGESIARGLLHWRPSPSLTVDTGGEFAFSWLQTRTRFTVNGGVIPIPAGNVRVSENRGEASANLTWRAARTLSVEAGLRVETSTIASSGDVALSRSLTFAKPRAVLTWSPDAANQLRLRVEREVGQLDFNDFAASAALNANGVVAGNPNLLPQQDWIYEVAAEHHFGKSGVVSLTYARLSLRDAIDRVPVFAPSGVFDERGNIGRGKEDDLTASFTLPLSRLGLKGAQIKGQSTWHFSRVTDPTTLGGRRISGQHPVDAELHFTQDLPGRKFNWGLDLFVGYVETLYRFDEIDVSRAGTVANVFLDYRPRPDLAMRLALASPKEFELRRELFGGPRGALPPATVDLQHRRFGPVLYTRVRKTF
jgi:outer membrane receptor protein involved in Fe transport